MKTKFQLPTVNVNRCALGRIRFGIRRKMLFCNYKNELYLAVLRRYTYALCVGKKGSVTKPKILVSN
jgi:hypothetical protein